MNTTRLTRRGACGDPANGVPPELRQRFRALDVLFILHADHEQNCSTSAMRGVGSSQPARSKARAAMLEIPSAARLLRLEGATGPVSNLEIARTLREMAPLPRDGRRELDRVLHGLREVLRLDEELREGADPDAVRAAHRAPERLVSVDLLREARERPVEARVEEAELHELDVQAMRCATARTLSSGQANLDGSDADGPYHLEASGTVSQ